MAPAEHTKLDGIAAGAEVNPDLSNYLQKNDNVSELQNDANYITLADVPAQTTPGLQAVLDEGNTSTTDLWVGDNGQTVKLLNTGKVEASTSVEAPAVKGTTSVEAPAIKGTTSVEAPEITATTSVEAPAVKGTTSVEAPTITATGTITGATLVATGDARAAAFRIDLLTTLP